MKTMYNITFFIIIYLKEGKSLFTTYYNTVLNFAFALEFMMKWVAPIQHLLYLSYC